MKKAKIAVSPEVRAYMRAIAAAGGHGGRGASKVRGGAEHYAELGRRGAEARRARKERKAARLSARAAMRLQAAAAGNKGV